MRNDRTPITPGQRRTVRWGLAAVLLSLCYLPHVAGQDILGKLGEKQNYRSKRISSYDRTGGNRDSVSIEPGKTAILAEIKGPAAIHHIWVTIAAEAFYGRKIVLRVYWDGEDVPSVEAPIGDFFGVGHGLNRDLASLPIACSSEGRARNCYWYMPFRWSCRVTVTNEGQRPVDAFYYYIDYRELDGLRPDAPYFHAQYRQEFPCVGQKNYVILDAAGAGHYVGCNLSVLQRTMGWWGEGDDMIYVDGEATPSLHGTGSEDYFSDAWGMREGERLFYGCPLQEEDFQPGSKATVYRFHIPDPVPFKKSIRVTIEHGHGNDRSDYYSSVAYWYQTEPHVPYPALPAEDKRLPFALESPENFIFPRWEEVKAENQAVFEDRASGLRLSAPRLMQSLTSYYNAAGVRYPLLRTDGAAVGTQAGLRFSVETLDLYSVGLYFLKAPTSGNFHILKRRSAPDNPEGTFEVLGTFEGYSREGQLSAVTLKDILLDAGPNSLFFQAAGKDEKAAGQEIAFVGMSLNPSSRRFILEWNLIGPFQAADMTDLQTVYPPEKETDFAKKYKGKNEAEVGWRTVQADATGYIRLDSLVQPNEQVLVYGLVYVLSPDDRRATVLLGSDDGIRVWVNDELAYTNPSYRGAEPDQDRFSVNLKKGWNKVQIKVLQGAGGWGYYFRLSDPKGELRWSLRPEEAKKPG
ncbi:MAG: glycoside hydrolase family 172 protein [Candidatus Aminicenantales bacterium]